MIVLERYFVGKVVWLMNTRQLRYAVELSKTLNFSQVAEKLGITQPALSKQISNLEQELAVKLFDRTTNPMQLTAAGEYFLSEANKLLFSEERLLRSMEEFKSGNRGQLVVGATPFRSQYLIPKVVKKFKEAYPQVKIILKESGNEQLRKDTAEGKFDLCVVNLPVDETILDATPIESDILVLAVPNEIAKTLPVASGGMLPQLSLEMCKDVPFVTCGRNQEMRQLLEKSCALANIDPIIAMEVVGVSTAYAMCLAGIGATLIPLQYVNHLKENSGVTLFSLKQNVYTRQLAVITRHGQYVSEYARHFIKLITE